MLLYIDRDNKITSYSTQFSKESAELEIQQGAAVLYDGEFNFFMGEDREGFVKNFYYDKETKQIHIDYQPKKEEIAVNSSKAKLDYLMMMQEGENV